MLKEIYNSMLEIANNQETPSFIDMVFYINQEKSKEFWAEAANKKERNILLDEWDSPEPKYYTKKLYGIQFAIKFK